PYPSGPNTARGSLGVAPELRPAVLAASWCLRVAYQPAVPKSPVPPPPLVRDPSSYGGPVRPASAKATAVRRSFSEGGSAEGAKAGSPQVPTNSYGTGRLCCR